MLAWMTAFGLRDGVLVFHLSYRACFRFTAYEDVKMIDPMLGMQMLCVKHAIGYVISDDEKKLFSVCVDIRMC